MPTPEPETSQQQSRQKAGPEESEPREAPLKEEDQVQPQQPQAAEPQQQGLPVAEHRNNTNAHTPQLPSSAAGGPGAATPQPQEHWARQDAAGDAALQRFRPFHVARAVTLEQMGDAVRAAECYRRALELPGNEAEGDFLAAALAGLG